MDVPIFNGKRTESMDYRFLGDKDNTPTEEICVEKASGFARNHNLLTGNAVGLLYVTASRVEEITKYRYVGIDKSTLDIRKPPISVGDVTMQETPNPDNPEDTIPWIYIKTRVEKHFRPKEGMNIIEREKQLRKNVYKTMKLPLIPSHPLFPLLDILCDAIAELTDGNNSLSADEFNLRAIRYANVPLYNKSDRWLYKVMQKNFGINPHMLRHWRCKHLVNNYDYKTSELVAAIKWGSPQMAMTYTEASEKELDAKQLKRARANDVL